LMETIDEMLLLLLGQAVEARFVAQRLFLTGEGLPLMALEPVAEMGTTCVRRR
jgi:hypothetical protein